MPNDEQPKPLTQIVQDILSGRTITCRLRVYRVGFTADHLLPVYPSKQTYSMSASISQNCQQRTLLRRVCFGWSLPTPSLLVYCPSIALGSCHRDVPRSRIF